MVLADRVSAKRDQKKRNTEKTEENREVTEKINTIFICIFCATAVLSAFLF
jgi:hypothetical protein